MDSFTGRNDWKRHAMDGFDRRKGVIKAEDFQFIDSFFTNIPDRVE